MYHEPYVDPTERFLTNWRRGGKPERDSETDKFHAGDDLPPRRRRPGQPQPTNVGYKGHG